VDGDRGAALVGGLLSFASKLVQKRERTAAAFRHGLFGDAMDGRAGTCAASPSAAAEPPKRL
jgi:hypothetical protein